MTPRTHHELLRDDGTRLHYSVVGEGEQDVLLAHGLTSTGDLEWRYLLPLLADRYRCLVPDLRGHGSSDHHDEHHGWDVVAADLRALLAQEGSEQPHLIGFSFGSECLLRLAVAEPDLPASLTLIGTSTGRPAHVDPSLRRPSGPMVWPDALKRAHADKHGEDHWEVLVSTMARRWQHLDEISDTRLADLPCPVLVVMGEHELPFKRAQARRLPDVLTDASLVVVPDVGHEVHILARDTVGPLVLAHLDAVHDRTSPAAT